MGCAGIRTPTKGRPAVTASEMLTPAFAVRAGKFIAADSALVPSPALLAA